MTVLVDDEILKHPEKQFYKMIFLDTLSIGDVDEGDNSTKLSIDVDVVRL